MHVPEATIVRLGAMELKFLVDTPELVIFEWTIPPQSRVPVQHYHRDVDEVLYGIEGTLVGVVDGEACELNPGDSLVIPRGRVHYGENRSSQTTRVLVVLNPGSISRRYFEEIAEQVNVPGKPDHAKMGEIMQRYGLIPA